MSMSMAYMPMTFTDSTGTTLYAAAWTPTSAAAYGATCLFLLLLALLFRALLAARLLLERHWHARDLRRRPVRVAGRYLHSPANSVSFEKEAPEWERDEPRLPTPRLPTPWRTSVDAPRALAVTLIAAVGYLL